MACDSVPLRNWTEPHRPWTETARREYRRDCPRCSSDLTDREWAPIGSPAELEARTGLVLRRRTAPGPFRVGDLEIDRAKRRVTVAGRPVRLTATEYRLLHALSLDAGGATAYEVLQRRVWGPGKGDPQAVRSAVTKLRRKLGDDARNPRYILGERGLGYRMPEPDSP